MWFHLHGPCKWLQILIKMGSNKRDFIAESIKIGNIDQAIYEDSKGRLCLRDKDFVNGICLTELQGNVSIDDTLVGDNTDSIADIYDLITDRNVILSELQVITGSLQQQITNNYIDIQTIYGLVGDLSAADDDFFTLVADVSSNLQNQLDDIKTTVESILTGNYALIDETNTFLEDNFFNTNVSIANNLTVGGTIQTENFVLSGGVFILQKQDFRDEIEVYSNVDVDNLLFNKIDKVFDAFPGNVAVWGISGVLEDGGKMQYVFSEVVGVSGTPINVSCVDISTTNKIIWKLVAIDENNGSRRHCSTVVAIHDGTSGVDFTEYAVLKTGGSPTLEVDVTNDGVEMCLVVNSVSSTWNVKVNGYYISGSGL